MREIAPTVAAGRVIVAHLGSGASMCALANGRSVESTMGFTALDGIPMGTRPGQIDPGVLLYLLMEKGMAPNEVQDLLYRDSGLKGLSGISNDMRELQSNPDPRARLAVDHFVYRVGLNAGMLAAALGGLDAFVFTAGIGENSPIIRARIAEKLAWLGVVLDPGSECRRQIAHFAAGEPPCPPRRADGRGVDDRAAHPRAAAERQRAAKSSAKDLRDEACLAEATSSHVDPMICAYWR